MDVDVFPLAEVDLKVGDVAISFDNDDEKLDYGGNSEACNSGIYGNYHMQGALSFYKKEPGYEAFNVHFLSTNHRQSGAQHASRRFHCEECGKYFTRNEHLKNHMRTHSGERPFECDLCQRAFPRHFDLTRHKQYVHGTVLQFFICEGCGRTFSRKDHLKSHLLTHKNQSPAVGADSKDVTTLMKEFTCDTCGRNFGKLEQLKKHMQKHFESIEGANFVAKGFGCGGEGEERSSAVNFHFMSVSDVVSRGDGAPKTYPCEFCGRLFSRKDHLKNHERTHTGERPFQCSECDRRFTKRYVMTRHVQNVHGINIKLHACSECDRKFTRNDHLKIHMKIHILKALRNQQKEKVHKCDVCGKECAGGDQLRSHRKIHHSLESPLLRPLGAPPTQSRKERDDSETATYFCELCSSTIPLREFQEHEKAHHSNS